MTTKSKTEAQNPLILRSHRLMEAFTKSDDERDFYLDRFEGFIVYVNLDKTEEELDNLEKELKNNQERYCPIPKLTFYETKKIMEGFVNEKVYDIDTKEKLLDVIQSKEARENFLEFIYDHLSELEKWQQYYQERSRIRIIEWLRNNHFHFVFEEDLELPKQLIEKVKKELFLVKGTKDVIAARKILVAKAKTYYSNEALNPRPKRGRPPKQAIKQEIESHITTDIYTSVPPQIHPFLFIPDMSNASSITFSTKFETEEQLIAHRKPLAIPDFKEGAESLSQKLNLLRNLSNKWVESEPLKTSIAPKTKGPFVGEDDQFDEDLNQKPAKVTKLKKTAIKLPAKKPTRADTKPKVATPKLKSKAALPKLKAKPKKVEAAPKKAKKVKLRPVKKLVKKGQSKPKSKK